VTRRAGRSWDHAARRLTDAEADHADRWGRRCAMSPKCAAAVTTATSYRYVTGRGGRTTTSERTGCDDHAAKFAAKHSIAIAAAPAGEPSRRGAIIADAAAVFHRDLPYWVKLTRNGRSWCLTEYGGGLIILGTVWLDEVPGETALEEVLPLAETKLARQRRKLITHPWNVKGETAAAPVAKAEETPDWADKPWTFAVYEDGSGTWQAVYQLAPQFAPERHPLGTTGIDLDRAIRTTHALLGDHWDFGPWTRTTNTATCIASRKEVSVP
jgi:hypothetical protein